MSKIKLKKVSKIITKGTTPTTVGGDFKSDGINFIKSESISDSKFLNKSLFSFIDEETDEKLKRSRIFENDLLFSIAGAYLGKIAKVTYKDIPANTNQAVGIVRLDNEKVDVDYLYYYFSQNNINRYINIQSSQSSQPNLNLTLLGDLEFENKPLPTQQKIASVLSALDDKIELNNRINAELEAMAKTLYDYWFVQFDFPIVTSSGVEKPYKSSGGKMVYNETLKREIPEGWEVKTVGNILDKNKATNKINAKEYLNMGKIPVIDQSTNLICGFTNDESSLITTKEKPAIVFGDHTRILKLINFDFARGADGTQILFSKIENMPQFLLYYSLLKIDLSNYGYARHFKFLKEQNLLIPKKEIAKEFNDLVKSY